MRVASIYVRGTAVSIFSNFLFWPSLVCLVTQLCPTLCDHMDRSPPGSSVHGDSPGKNAGVGCHCPPSRGSSQPQGSNPGLLHSKGILYPSEPPGYNPIKGALLSFSEKGLWVFPLIEVLLLISGDFIHQLVESFTFHCQRNTSVHMFPHSPALLEKQEWGVIPTEGSAENSGGRSTCEVRDDELAVWELILVYWWFFFVPGPFFKELDLDALQVGMCYPVCPLPRLPVVRYGLLHVTCWLCRHLGCNRWYLYFLCILACFSILWSAHISAVAHLDLWHSESSCLHALATYQKLDGPDGCASIFLLTSLFESFFLCQITAECQITCSCTLCGGDVAQVFQISPLYCFQYLPLLWLLIKDSIHQKGTKCSVGPKKKKKKKPPKF